jgi:hypothetical protein
MPTKDSIARSTEKSVRSYLKKNAGVVEGVQKHSHQMSETIRQAEYKGHHIVLRTTYELEIDGKPVLGHLQVDDAGRVHYHPVPNLSFASALDMAKQLIDVFPDDFNGNSEDDHHEHPMTKSRKAPKSRAAGGKTKKSDAK